MANCEDLGEETAFSLTYGKVSYLILSEIVGRPNLDCNY